MSQEQRILSCTGDNEWYTPVEYIEAARAVMGEINLDPASCSTANEVVRADTYYDKAENGLEKPWYGNVWLNPPYAKRDIQDFAKKLVQERENITQAIILVNNCTETEWFKQMASVSDAVMFPRGRVRFWEPGGRKSNPIQGQAVIYAGNNSDKFIEIFGKFGWSVRIV